MSSYTKSSPVSLKNNSEFTEKRLQDIIANDPSLLGLGELYLIDKERKHPKAGRLDLLLQDIETQKRYEVELQLGAVDESHIIRTIEYWDIERKRYPQYDHCAVIIAEDITSRFLNVIQLLNGTIPLIAIQMNAHKVGEHLTLTFTKVIDEMNRGLVDDDEVEASAPADRSYWEDKATKKTLSLVDKIVDSVRIFDSELNIKYNKFYIGIEKSGLAFNFITFRPRKGHLNFEIKHSRSIDIDEIIDNNELETLEYNNHWGLYRIRITKNDIEKKMDVLTTLAKKAYDLKLGN